MVGHTQQAGSMHNVPLNILCMYTCTVFSVHARTAHAVRHVHMHTCMHSACFSSHDVRCCVHSMRVGLGCGCEWLEWTCTTCTRECTVHWIQARVHVYAGGPKACTQQMYCTVPKCTLHTPVHLHEQLGTYACLKHVNRHVHLMYMHNSVWCTCRQQL